MDILDAKEDEAWREVERRRDELIALWNDKFPVGTVVRGRSYKLLDHDAPNEVEFDGPTTSKAYSDGTTAVVDVAGHAKVSLHREFKSIKWDGSHSW